MTAHPTYAVAMADEELTKAISLRLTDEDKSALDALAKAYPLKALTIARIAMRIGMAEINRNPGALFMGPHVKASEEHELEADAPSARADVAAGKSVSVARHARAVLTTINNSKSRKKR